MYVQWEVWNYQWSILGDYVCILGSSDGKEIHPHYFVLYETSNWKGQACCIFWK